MLTIFIVVCPSVRLCVFPFFRLTINNNNTAIYAPMDDDRPYCFLKYQKVKKRQLISVKGDQRGGKPLISCGD